MAGKVSRRAQPSLKERRIILTSGSFIRGIHLRHTEESAVVFVSEAGIPPHETEHVRNSGDVLRQVELVGAKRRVAVRSGRVIAMHPAQRQPTHVARENKTP